MSTKIKLTKQIVAKEENKELLLSDLINSEYKQMFIKNNKKALLCFEDFIRLQKNKSRNKRLAQKLININSKSNIEKFKKNPLLILKSYDKTLFDVQVVGKYKCQTLGVDEGLITGVKNEKGIELTNSNYLRGNETSRFKSNLKLINLENDKKGQSRNNYTNLKNSSKSLTNKYIIKETEMDRGTEFISTNASKNIKMNNEQNVFLKMQNLKEDFEQKLKYNFELKKLNTWDFLNLPNSDNNSLQNIIPKARRRKSSMINFSNLNEADASNMGWLLHIRNDKDQLKVMERIKRLNDFFLGFGKEQEAIFKQATKMDRNDSNFEVFYKSKEELQNTKTEEDNLLSGVNFYKEVMKVKTKREEMFRGEICACAEQLSEAKVEKQKLIISSYELLIQLDKLNKKEVEILNELNISSNQIVYNSIIEKKSTFREKKMTVGNIVLNTFKENKNNIYLYREKKRKSEKKIRKKNKFLKLQMNNSKILQSLIDLKKQKKTIKEKIKQIHLDLKDINLKLKKAKANYTEKVQLLSEYYYQILKKGIDVRKSGLSWVIVRLMELHAFIDKNHFPNFLSDDEINYLMKIGVKTYELNELLNLFQILKTRQKQLRERHVQEDKAKENQIKEENLNKIKEANKGNKFNIGNAYVEYMEEIQRKYENVINICLNEKKEEIDINQISDKIKKQILTMGGDEIYNINGNKAYSKYFIPGSLAQYFSQDKIFRQYFDDIYYLNEEIVKRKQELRNLKEKQYKKYKRELNTRFFIKNVLGKEIITKNKHLFEKDVIMAALFGNDIPV